MQLKMLLKKQALKPKYVFSVCLMLIPAHLENNT